MHTTIHHHCTDYGPWALLLMATRRRCAGQHVSHLKSELMSECQPTSPCYRDLMPQRRRDERLRLLAPHALRCESL
jgi:hypothetical protein